MNCLGFVALKHLTPDLTDTEKSVFCLNYDSEQRSFTDYSVGVRNAYLECR